MYFICKIPEIDGFAGKGVEKGPFCEIPPKPRKRLFFAHLCTALFPKKHPFLGVFSDLFFLMLILV